MFRPGKVLKVKVELSPDVVGFGRATILEAEGGRLFLHLKTAKGEKRSLPKGTRLWFISDSADNPFNGLWSSTILSSRVIGGKTALECARPTFEAAVQRRKQKRVQVDCNVRLQGTEYEQLSATTRNLSRAGVGIEIADDAVEQLPIGHHLDFVLETSFGPINMKGRVIQARYNWLANRTDIGIEFVRVADEAARTLDQLITSLTGKPRLAPAGKEAGTVRGGELSGGLKSTKDNVSFNKHSESAETLPSDDDMEELVPDEDESSSDAE